MKKVVIGIIIGAIIFGSVGVYAATKYLAEEVQYRETNVKEALDTLYEHRFKEEVLSGWQATSNLPTNWGGIKVTPTIAETNNVVTINFSSSNISSQGTVYKKIENIEKYKYIIVQVVGKMRSGRIGLTPDITKDAFPWTKTTAIFIAASSAMDADSNLSLNTEGLTGTYYLVFAGMNVSNTNIIAKGIY